MKAECRLRTHADSSRSDQLAITCFTSFHHVQSSVRREKLTEKSIFGYKLIFTIFLLLIQFWCVERDTITKTDKEKPQK